VRAIEPDDRAVADVVARFEASLARDVGRTRALAEQLITTLEPLAGVRVTSYLQALRPVVVAAGTGARVGRAVRHTARSLARIVGSPEVAAALPSMSAHLGEHPFPTLAPGDLDLLRPDGALDASGAFAMMELNAGSCVGGLVEVEAIAEVMANWYGGDVPVRWPRPATDVARMLQHRYGRGARVAWVTVPGGLHAGDGMAEAGEAFARRCHAAGLWCEPAEADELTWRGDGLALWGERVDVLWRLMTPRAWCTSPGAAHLREAVARGAVKLFTSPFDLALTHKGALAWLSRAAPDPRGVDVPWTRLARPAVEGDDDVLVRVRAEAAGFVLKPGVDRQGRRVVLGEEAGPRWAQHLVAAVLADDCVVQARIAPVGAALPYVVDGELTRAEVAVVTSPVVARGAATTLCARTSVPGGTSVLTHPFGGATGLLPVVEA